MTDEQILRKAIEKAVENGYWSNWSTYHKYEQKEILKRNLTDEHYYSLIFSHAFAKAFWREDKTKWNIQARLSVHFKNLKWYLESAKGEFLCPIFIPAWQYHIQRMALEKEPLKYLERFL